MLGIKNPSSIPKWHGDLPVVLSEIHESQASGLLTGLEITAAGWMPYLVSV